MSLSKNQIPQGAVPAGGGEAETRAHILEVALSHTIDFAYILDLAGRFVYANKPLLDLWGLALEQVVGKNFFDLQYPADLATRLQNQVQHVISTRERVVDETAYTSPSGVEGYYEYIFNPVFSTDGEINYVAGNTRVITERKRADDAGRQLAAIVESSYDAIISKNLNGIITSWNHGATILFGYSAEEIIGKPVLLLIPPDRHDEEPGIIQQIREGKRIDHYETIRVRKDGSLVDISLTISPIKNAAGEIVGASKIARDISERKWAEKELGIAREREDVASRTIAESAERFRLLAEVVSLQVWTATPGGELDWVNQECLKYFNIEQANADAVLGSGWATFVHPDDLQRVGELWQVSLASGARYEVEFRLRGGKGDYRWFLVRAEAMHDSGGNIIRWFGTNTDIHELKLAQAEAERASRAKDEFFATLSHELRTPLTPVLMTAAALRNDPRLPQEVRDQLEMMERNISLEARLIDDLLDLTRITRGQLRLRLEQSDAHSLIELAEEIVRDDALAKGIKLERKLNATCNGMMVDPARFQQVIWNLLRNAVKFTPEGGRISIQTSDEKDSEGALWLRIEVIDSGIGIEPSVLDQIFLPFDQGTLSGDHRFGGVGLGLAIARAIVSLHGGRIGARSEGLNRGAAFTVQLPGAMEPLSEKNPSTAGRPSSAESQSHGKVPQIPLRLLLVEDHESTLQVMSRLLARAGHSVVTSSTVAGAVAAAGTHDFDFVISDLGLPDGTGIELMEILRDRHGLRGVALSGYGMEEDIERSQDAGFVTHLIKPVDFSQLQRVLSEVARQETPLK